MRKFFILFLCIIILYQNTVFAIESKDASVPTSQNKDAAGGQPKIKTPPTQEISNNIDNPKKIDSSKEFQEESDTLEDAVESTIDVLSPPHQNIVESKESINQDKKDSDNLNIPDGEEAEDESAKKESEEDLYTKEQHAVRINEILPNPDGSDNGNEFIELYNDSTENISLKDWRIYDKTKKYYTFSDIEIEAGKFITLYNKKDFSFALNNSDEEIYLEDEDENIITEFSYKTSSSGLSWNYDEEYYLEISTPNKQNNENPLTKDYPEIFINEIFPKPKDNEDDNEFIELYNPNNITISLENWTLKDASQSGKYILKNITIPAKNYLVIYRSDFSFALNNSGDETISLIAPSTKTISSVTYNSTREGRSLNYSNIWYWEKPTPNEENRVNPLTQSYPTLLLSEILPNPIGNESTDEFIEIYNPNSFPVDLESWTLHDASASGAFTFMNSLLVQPHAYHTIYRADFSFALNNSNETLSLIAPNEKVVSQFSYKSSRKNISHNYDNITKLWRQSKHLTPNQKNIFNNLPEITKFDVDEKIYKNVYAEFEAKAHDKDQEELKVRWDFGDNHKSYKWETRHKYESAGTFHGSLRIQDGSEEFIKNFTVAVKKYPKYKISITKIVPNPAGKDSGNEYIVVKNKSHKKINLKNWSIATGSTEKTLVNHPIRDNLYVKSGKTKTIKKKHAAISLPNKVGVIEIRRPNGSTSHIKEYGDKSTSISDNASYEKIDNTWQWIIPTNFENQREVNAIVTQALRNEMMFSQQLLEQKIAYSAIYQEEKDEDTSHSMSQNQFSLLEEVNKIINSIFIMTKRQLYALFEKEHAHIAVEAYKIQKNRNPCTTPHIATPNKYNFCK